MFHREDNPRGMWALPFSLDTLQPTGEPFLVVPDLTVASFSTTGDMVYSQADLQSGKQKLQAAQLDLGDEKEGAMR